MTRFGGNAAGDFNRPAGEVFSGAMIERDALRAIVTVQAAHVPASVNLNLYVRLLLMVPKGLKNVTVPTNCTTTVLSGTINPVWNQTFSLPVRRQSDVLVFNVNDQEASPSGPRRHLVSTTTPLNDPSRVRPTVSRSSPGASSADVSESSVSASQLPGEDEQGHYVGVCLIPMELVPESGEVLRRRLEIFEAEDASSGVGFLYVAVKLQEIKVDQWEKSDLRKDHLISQLHRSRLSAFEDRFIGIGELAAFLFEEGYSQDVDANWDRAVTILSEQLAYRIYETTRSTADRANFLAAKEKVVRDQGLWDAI